MINKIKNHYFIARSRVLTAWKTKIINIINIGVVEFSWNYLNKLSIKDFVFVDMGTLFYFWMHSNLILHYSDSFNGSQLANWKSFKHVLDYDSDTVNYF
jgi:hypothetical protein